MSNKNLSRQQPQQPDPELLERFLRLQEAELATRSKELEIRQLEITKTHEFSKDGLDAQLTDRQNARESSRKSEINLYIFCGILAFAVIGFLGFALWLNKDPVALEIVKGAAFIVAGYLGGRYHQKSKEEKPKVDE